MDLDLEAVDDFLNKLGYDTSAKKSLFQQNEEMASILVTFMMSEIDLLRMKVAELEAKVNE